MLLNKRFTIGEMAKMHNIAESTYAIMMRRIFHPSTVDPQTKYRYYTIDQFSLLDTIKFLRQLNIPLKEIKNILMREIQHMHSIYWKTTRDDVENKEKLSMLWRKWSIEFI